jgi:hypothetical protein
MRRMIGDTKRALEYRCDAGRGPNIATKPKGFRPACQQRRYLALLGHSQRRLTARSRVAPQRLCATALASALDPLADRALGHAEGLSDAGLGPALLVQFPGPQPAAFAPVERWCCMCDCHASMLPHKPSVISNLCSDQ